MGGPSGGGSRGGPSVGAASSGDLGGPRGGGGAGSFQSSTHASAAGGSGAGLASGSAVDRRSNPSETVVNKINGFVNEFVAEKDKKEALQVY